MFKKLFRYKIPRVAFLLSLLAVLSGWIWAYFALRSVSGPLILQYQSALGINQVGYAGELARVGVFGFLVVAVNFLISTQLEERVPFWGGVASFMTVFLGILIFIYFAAIISVN